MHTASSEAAATVEPTAAPDPDSAGEWTSYAFVGTRVSTADHTFCGCQTMRGDASRFRLTEHGRAQLPIAPRQAGGRASGHPTPWDLRAGARWCRAISRWRRWLHGRRKGLETGRATLRSGIYFIVQRRGKILVLGEIERLLLLVVRWALDTDVLLFSFRSLAL